MKIGMILDNTFPPDSRVENEAISLINAGHDVYLFAFGKGEFISEENYKNIKVKRYPLSELEYKLSALAYSIPVYHAIMTRRILDFVRKYTPDVLHVHDIAIARAAFSVARKTGLPVTLDLHENRPVIMKDYVHLKKWPGKWLIDPETWARFEKKYVRQADSVIVVTEEAKLDLVRSSSIDSSKVIVVPNTVSKEAYMQYSVDPALARRFEENFTLLYMGDTGLRRGTDTAILALKLLVSKIPEIRLVLVGMNSEDVELKRMVSELKLQEYVVFEGWQDVSTFPGYVEASDICLSPLKRNRHHDTTFANKIFQYMYGARPIVVSDCPPQVRIVETEKCGLCFKAEDHAELAERILWLYEHCSSRTEMGRNGHAAVMARWNWEKTSTGFLNLYSSEL